MLINIAFDQEDVHPKEYPNFYSKTGLILNNIEWEGKQLPQKGEVITGIHNLIPTHIWNSLSIEELGKLAFTSENGMTVEEITWEISEKQCLSYHLLLRKRITTEENGVLKLRSHE